MADVTTTLGKRRLLVYQPNHGLGMEMALLDAAVRLGRLLDRAVVLPLLPILETLEYQGGIEQYFHLDPDVDWISTREFRRQYGGEIGHLFHLLPHWRPEYGSKINRDLHPVWLRNIHHCEYFPRVGLSVREVSRHAFRRALRPEAVRQIFSTSVPAIGFSYINGLLAEESPLTPPPDDDFRWLTYAPPHPRRELLATVEQALGSTPDVALHVRRANLEMARAISGIELPPISAYCELVPADARTVYVATDVDSTFDEVRKELPQACRIRTGHITRDAVIDIAACTLAGRFIGTHCSTFSMYIVHARSRLGHEPSSTTMLR